MDQIGYEQLSDNRFRETVKRPDGRQIITIRQTNGEIAQRDVVMPDGQSFVLIASGGQQPRRNGSEWRDPGDDLPPMRLTISARDYVLDADDAEPDDVAFFLVQPPVEAVRRIYSIEEVKHSARIRDAMRRLEIGGLTFDTGKSTLAESQQDSLDDVADAMLDLLDRNPAETFLIEGHTDAVGSELSNLELSDNRAIEVARILSEEYDIPPENLATQGYGETFLKVKTSEAEALNRRVTIRRITPLITVARLN
jgi:outer membrane protein OmpA-like peptidoglycan-associated protein